MRISSLALALLVAVSLGITGCDRSDDVTNDTEPTNGDTVVVEPDAPGVPDSDEPLNTEPESDASASPGLRMPSDAVDADLEPAVDDQAAAPEPLTIGSQAPPLDIEHWIQDGNGQYEPVSEFEEGNVYIIEFWATWCQPCINSMPHLAETQREYADQGVRLISVSDEPLETVEGFLDGEVHSSATSAEGEEAEKEEKQTYRELTSVYSLTTDPDRSTHTAYMDAADQAGIPTAFIVGKTGEVEWIGHPMTMDEPLEAIVKGDWDRAEFAKQMELRTQMAEAQGLMRRGQMEEGLQQINQLIMETDDPELLLELKFFKLQALIMTQSQPEEVPTLASDLLEIAADRAEVVPQLAWVIYQATRTSEVPEDLLEKTITAAEQAVEDMDPDQRPSMLDTVAHLHEANGNIDAAIAAQQEAVDLTEGRTKERLKQYLDELKAEKEGSDAESEEADEAKPEEAAEESSDAPEVVEEVTDSEDGEEAAETETPEETPDSEDGDNQDE